MLMVEIRFLPAGKLRDYILKMKVTTKGQPTNVLPKAKVDQRTWRSMGAILYRMGKGCRTVNDVITVTCSFFRRR